MPCRKKPIYKTKKQALRHGHITYGETRSGKRKFRVKRVKKGWVVYKL